MQEKVTLKQIAEALIQQNDCSYSTAETFLKSLFAIIPEQINNGSAVSIKGLGVFKKSENDDEIICFEPDKSLINTLNQPFSSFEPIELDEDITEELFESELKKINYSNGDLEETLGQDDYPKQLVEQKVIDGDSSDFDSIEINKVEESQNEGSLVQQKNIDNLFDDHSQQIVNDDQRSDKEIEAHFEKSEENKKSNRKYIILIGFILFISGLMLGFIGGYITKDIILSTMNTNENVLKYDRGIIGVEQRDSGLIVEDQLVSDSTILDTDTVEAVSNNQQDVITDQITKSRFLTTMAREHYGNLNFWVYIYEENQDKLGHPDKIKPGTIVEIPPITKYNIDPSNIDAINIAKDKAREIYSKYKN